MPGGDQIKEWWIKALIGEQTSAHPVFGRHIQVDVDRDVVTLSGEVGSADEAEEIEREAQRLDQVGSVINRLVVTGAADEHPLQTIIAVFPDVQTATLARRSVGTWKLREDREPDLLTNADEARDYLQHRARAAQVPADRVQRYLDALRAGKVVLVDRVPEDDAFRVISALEGTDAESVQTLPPEPEAHRM